MIFSTIDTLITFVLGFGLGYYFKDIKVILSPKLKALKEKLKKWRS